MAKKYIVTVNGVGYEVIVEETAYNASTVSAPAAATAPAAAPAAAPAPEAAPAAAPAAAAAGEGTAVEAPMPGTILKVLVSNGQAVKAGDTVVVLEAMKMENEITAPSDGTVTAVCVNQGDSVDAGKVLVTIK